MKRRLLAIILAVAMIASVFAGYSVSADDVTFDETVESNDTVSTLNDISESIVVFAEDFESDVYTDFGGGDNISVISDTDEPANKILRNSAETTPEVTVNPFEGQDGSEFNPYQISDAEKLVAFEDIVNSGNVYACAVLTADIDMTGVDFEPIGTYSDSGTQTPYGGTFDGNGHTIRNLSVVVNTAYETGLFGRTSGATIKNLNVTKATIVNTANTRSGILGGEIFGSTVTNCFTDGTVSTGSAQAGGIAGEAAWGSTTMTNCATTMSSLAYGAVFVNCYYVSQNNAGWNGAINITDINMYKTGEAAYIMNTQIGGDTPVWYQNIDKGSVDEFPIASNTHGIVYEVDLIACGTEDEVIGKTYSNFTEPKVNGHVYVDGGCSCGATVTEEELNIARLNAINELNGYVNLDDYIDEQKVEVQNAISSATAAINAASTYELIDSALENGKTSIDAIKTSEELWRDENAEYLASKITELENYVDKSLYRTEQQTSIDNIIAEASDFINQSSGKEMVEAKVAEAKTAIDAIETDFDYTLEENIAKWNAFYAQYAKQDLYSEDNWILVQECNTNYSNKIATAQSVAEINSIYSESVEAISAIERNVTYNDGALLKRSWNGKGSGTVASIDAFLLDNSYINNEYSSVGLWEQSTFLNENTNETFMLSMSGYVAAPQTGKYLFRIYASDDSVRVDLNNDEAMWYNGVNSAIESVDPAADTVCELSMVAGKRVPINILVSDMWASEVARIQWQGPGIGDGETFNDIDRKYLSYSTENVKTDDTVELTNPITLNKISLVGTENGTVSGVNAVGYYATEIATLTATSNDGYIFGGWVVDGVPVDGDVLELTMDANHEVEAVFELEVQTTAEPTEAPTEEPVIPTESPVEPTEEPVVEYVKVVYKDTNNNTVKNSDAVKGQAIGSLPTMYRDGYIFEGWLLDSELINADTVVDEDITLKAKFVKDEAYQQTCTLSLGENVEYKTINGFDFIDGMQNDLSLADRVVLKMTETDGMEVDYWMINGTVVSTSQELSFLVQPGTMTVDVVLKSVGAYNTASITTDSLITSVVPRPDHNNRFYVYSMRVIEDASKVIECGVIIKRGSTAEDASDIEIGDDGVYQIKSSRQNTMGEYAIVRKDTETQYSVRSYMKYRDEFGNEKIVYSDAQTVIMPM